MSNYTNFSEDRSKSDPLSDKSYLEIFFIKNRMNNVFMENLREKFHEKHQVCLSIWKNVDMLCHNRHGNKISMSKKKVGNN